MKLKSNKHNNYYDACGPDAQFIPVIDKTMLKAAQDGDAEAQFQVGKLHEECDTFGNHKDRAIEWYIKAAEQGHADAQYHAGRYLLETRTDDKFDTTSIKWLTKAAEQGHVQAQCKLGTCYKRGFIVKTDYIEAVKWLTLAAKQGFPEAQYELGHCYHRGCGVDLNPCEAIKWYTRAADQGYSEAKNRLHSWLMEVVDPDFDEYYARKNDELYCKYYRATIKGDSESQQGDSESQQSDSESQQSDSESQHGDSGSQQGDGESQQGDGEALFNFAWCKAYGIGTEIDVKSAIKDFEKAAKQGYTEAQYRLGFINLYGDLVGHDLLMNDDEAFQWLDPAAAQEFPAAQYELGNCYLNGYGCNKDPEKAVALYRKAAAQNYGLAMLELGCCYEKGEGVAVDIDQARKLYTQAVEFGIEQGKKLLQSLDKTNPPACTQVTIEEPIEWYKEAAEYNSKAMYKLAICHLTGNGVPVDYIKAILLLYKAASWGERDAGNALDQLAKGKDQDSELFTIDPEPLNVDSALLTIDSRLLTKEVESLAKKAENGDAEAQYILGHCYMRGIGIAADTKKADHWYAQAAANNLADAQYDLAYCYFFGTDNPIEGITYIEDAIELFHKAAKSGHFLAQYELGKLYFRGFDDYIGIDRDDDDSRQTDWFHDEKASTHWMSLAAEQGYEEALLDMAWRYYNGYGVPRDIETARKLFHDTDYSTYRKLPPDYAVLEQLR